MHKYICICINTYICIDIYMCIDICVYTCINMYDKYIHIHVISCIDMYNKYVYIYVHTCTLHFSTKSVVCTLSSSTILVNPAQFTKIRM